MSEEIKVNKKRVPTFFVWFLIGLFVGVGSIYGYNKFLSKNPVDIANQMQQEQAQAQMKDLIAKVGKLIILPTGEDPVIATINDAAGLSKDQVFYKGSENGDLVLVYQKASKAIIYSPSRNLIVNVGPIFLQNPTTQTQTQTEKVSTSTTTNKK